MIPTITVISLVMAAFLLAPFVSAGATYDQMAQYNPNDPRTKRLTTPRPLVVPPSPDPVKAAPPPVIQPPRVVAHR